MFGFLFQCVLLMKTNYGELDKINLRTMLFD